MMPIRLLFPNVLNYAARHINLLLGRYVLRDYGYDSWISKIYPENNLKKKYGKLMQKFSEYYASQHIRLLFVLTPIDYDPSNESFLTKIYLY